MFRSIQYLRAFAALVVVFHHSRTPRPWLYGPFDTFVVGQAGVDIFFVISGFIMFTAARAETPLQFATRRIVRIAPLYWIATTITLAISYGALVLHGDVATITSYVKSLLFIPHYNLRRADQIWPILVPGWSLNYEMFFYVIFAFGLLARRLLPIVIPAILALVAIGRVVHSANPLWVTYTDPIMLEFVAGLLIARYRARLTRLGWLLPLGLVLLVLSGFVDWPRVLEWGVPAMLIVIGALSLEASGRLPHSAWLLRLGDASYSIYLFHLVGMTAVTALVRHLPIHGPLQLALQIGLTLAGAIVLGLAAYRWIETPIVRTLKTRRPERADILAAP